MRRKYQKIYKEKVLNEEIKVPYHKRNRKEDPVSDGCDSSTHAIKRHKLSLKRDAKRVNTG